MQTLCWSKTRPSFSGAHSSCNPQTINAIFVPRIGMYIRINIPKTDLVQECHILSEGLFFIHPCICIGCIGICINRVYVYMYRVYVYMCNELGEVNAGWIPARPASVDQDHTRNNRHNPLMV